MNFRNKVRQKRSIIWQIDIDVLNNTVKESKSFREILSKLNINYSGGNCNTIIRRLNKENISFDHIPRGRDSNKKRKFKRKSISLDKILVQNSSYRRGSLKARLIHEGLLKNKCYICNLLPVWNNKELILIIDHINGIKNDNRLENLRLLCPNCNSQTDTFSGRNVKKFRLV